MNEVAQFAVDPAQAQFEAAIDIVERIFGTGSTGRLTDTIAAVLAAIQANHADELH